MNHDEHRDEYLDDLADVLGVGEVVAALADQDATTPPAKVRRELVAAIGRRPRRGAPPASSVGLYTARVAAMAALLDQLGGDDWSAPAAPYPWSVHGLVAHLTVIEEYTVRQLGLGADPPAAAGDPFTADHLRLGADDVAEMLAGPPTDTVRRWTAAAELVIHRVGSAACDMTDPLTLHAWAFDVATALVVRAFEIWTHADDIRRATGRALDVPSAAELRTMSSTSVGGLPILLALTDGPPLASTRVVLTGPGGGTFDLAGNVDGPPAAANLLVADVVDYCRVAARRLDPESLAGTRYGDQVLLAALLLAAQAVAV